MDDQLEELAYFSLELLFGHGIFDYCQKRDRREDGAGWRCRRLLLG
jgi:hypothetical protein